MVTVTETSAVSSPVRLTSRSLAGLGHGMSREVVPPGQESDLLLQGQVGWIDG
jgi:hypothetical protein